MPFEQLFTPLVQQARESLRAELGSALEKLLTPAAQEGFGSFLLSRLVNAGGEAGQWQFDIFKSVRTAFGGQSQPRGGIPPDLYSDFVSAQPERRIAQLFVEFPGLDRLCSALISNWRASTVEFLHALEADYRHLSGHLSISPALPIIHLKAGLSDTHRQGRSVIQITFTNGNLIIYKPRSLAPEHLFFLLVEELNGSGIPHRLLAARSWDRGDYGWMENITAAPCSTAEEVRVFYWRAGVLLGLVYLLHGVDFHRENLIASGAFPVLIDLETLCHPPNQSRDCARRPRSVFSTGFLPQSDPARGHVYDLQALAGGSKMDQPVTGDHVPILGGSSHSADGFTADLEDGFLWIGAHFLVSERDRRRLGEWTSLISNAPRRLILRSTAEYHIFLSGLSAPASLRNNSALDAEGDNTTRGQRTFSRSELSALSQLDIPYFTQPSLDKVDSSSTFSWEEYRSQASSISAAFAAPT